MRLPRPKAAAAAALLAATLAGCGVADAVTTASVADSSTGTTSTATADPGASVEAVLADNQESHADADDGDYSAADAVTVTLDGSSATASGEGVDVDGGTVTITAPGTYVLSGTLTGQVVVDSSAEGKVRLVLDDATITSADGPAVDVEAADEVVVVLADASTNRLEDGSGYGQQSGEPNAALYSTADLTIAGTGSLDVTGNSNDGIGSQDGLVILSGTVTVTAVDDAVRGKDYVRVEGGTLTATGGGDALKSDNTEDADRGYVAILGGTLTLTAGDDGVSAATDAVVGGGTTTIAADGDGIHGDVSATVGGGDTTVTRSGEGLESKVVTVDGGSIDITSSDDGINGSDGSGQSGGPGGGGDSSASGVDVTISGGTVVVSGPTNGGNGALDTNGSFTVSGGTLLAAGSSGMAEAPGTDSEQGWVSATFDSAYPAGTVIQIVQEGDVIASYTAAKTFASVVFSSADITSGETYEVWVDGTPSGDAVAGLALGGSTEGGTQLGTVTADEHVGGQGGPGGHG